MYSNPGETLVTPFMGVGSEVYSAVRAGRRGLGIELKPSYYRQAIKNLATVEEDTEDTEQLNMFAELEAENETADETDDPYVIGLPGDEEDVIR